MNSQHADTEKVIEVLNDLVQINNDRIAGYEKALAGLNENSELAPLFKRMMNNSIDNNGELQKWVELFNGTSSTGTSGAGKVFRAWMDLKALITGGDHKAILDSCYAGEEFAIRVYDEILSKAIAGVALQDVIEKHRAVIVQSALEIKALRDAAT